MPVAFSFIVFIVVLCFSEQTGIGTVELRYQCKQHGLLLSVRVIAYVCVTFQSRACHCRFPAVVLLLVLFKEMRYEQQYV